MHTHISVRVQTHAKQSQRVNGDLCKTKFVTMAVYIPIESKPCVIRAKHESWLKIFSDYQFLKVHAILTLRSSQEGRVVVWL